MREHMGLFRGKRTDGEWVEGSLHTEYGETRNDGSRTIDYRILGMRGECDYVDPDTVGECTGLTDKNGKLIFERDVFEWGYAGVKEFQYVVAYDAELACFVGNRGGGFVTLNGIDIEIIGNVVDHPELLKGGEADE